MTPGSGQETVKQNATTILRPSFSSFPTDCALATVEQQQRFELVRLAFFVLKLRKIEERLHTAREESDGAKAREQELDFRASLLRHTIFQQMLTLIKLDARQQAMQIIAASAKG